MLITHVANTAGDHDRFVIAANLAIRQSGHSRFIRPEITQQIRSAKFIVKCGATDGPFKHNFERRCHALGMTKRCFPRLRESGYTQM